jgi:DNA-binding CsgD family transcriptional regulator
METAGMPPPEEAAVRFSQCETRSVPSKADTTPGIISNRSLGRNSFSAIGLFRLPNEPPFTSRELRIPEIIFSEVPWIHEEGWSEAHGVTSSRLPHRQRQTLKLMIEGRSRKQIAAHLGISVHTVSGYIKELYHHYRVQSHAGLMHRLACGPAKPIQRWP